MDKTELTIAAYSKSAEAYAAKFMHFGPYQQQVNDFIELLPTGVCVLDLGCGPGNTACQIIESGKAVSLIGVDLCSKMILTARLNVPEGDFFVQDLRETNYPSQTYDAVVMSFCIVHLTDPEAKSLVFRVADWLKSGGLLYLSFMEGKSPGWETTSFSDQAMYFNYYDAEMVMELLRQRGFVIKRVQWQGYPESNGSVTTDVFIFAMKE